MKRTLCILALALVAATKFAAGSETASCRPADTPDECWERIAPEPPTADELNQKSDEAKKEEGKNLQEQPTGADTSGESLGSSTKDFLPRLALTGLLGDATKDESSGDLVFDLNFLLPFLQSGSSSDNQEQLQLAVKTEPEIAEPVKMALPEDGRDAKAEELADGLGDTADYTVSFTYNWMRGTTGRGPEQYRDIFGELLDRVALNVWASYPDTSADVDQEIRELEDALMDLCYDLDQDPADFPQCASSGGLRPPPIDLNALFDATYTFEQYGEMWQLVRTEQIEGALQKLALEAAEARAGAALTDDQEMATIATLNAELDRKSLRSILGGYGHSADILNDLGVNQALARQVVAKISESLGEQRAQALLGKVESEARAALAEVKDHQKAINDAGLNVFSQLVSNQPQLHFGAKWRTREDVLGGDEGTLNLTYEWSLLNLNRVLGKECRRNMRTLTNAGKTCLERYRDQVRENKDNLTAGTRFSAKFEYVDTKGATVDLAALGIEQPDTPMDTDSMMGAAMGGGDPAPLMVEIKSETKLVGTVGYSRLFGQGEGSALARLDFQASLENVDSDDPMREKDRLVASLTVTRKWGNVSVPFGIVWANHGEYLTDVDEKLSTHIGIKFNLDSLRAANGFMTGAGGGS